MLVGQILLILLLILLLALLLMLLMLLMLLLAWMQLLLPMRQVELHRLRLKTPKQVTVEKTLMKDEYLVGRCEKQVCQSIIVDVTSYTVIPVWVPAPFPSRGGMPK